MAKKLKTLKDASHPTYTYDDVDYDTDFDAVYIDDLKTFAREWYEKSKLCDCPGVCWNEDNVDNAVAFNEGIEWFCKHFFDLDDEDDENEN